MKYLLMIYSSEQEEAKMTQADMGSMMAEYRKFTETISQSGHYLGGNRLRPTTDATTVRVRDGKTLTTDGPFAETREQLGGFYLIEAEHLDDAIGIASRIPSARNGSIEVRPVWPPPTQQ